jgi:FixJ family two-component response regulator
VVATDRVCTGAQDFIEKPVVDRQLVAAINRALARSFEHLDLQRSQSALDVSRDNLGETGATI